MDEVVTMIRNDRDRDDSDPVLTKMTRKMKKYSGKGVVKETGAADLIQKLDI